MTPSSSRVDLLRTPATAIVLAIVSLVTAFGNRTVFSADEITDESYWVVSDAYFLGKPHRSSVGMTIVFSQGAMYWLSKDGSRSDVHTLATTKSDGIIRFSCKSDMSHLGGKGLIEKRGSDCIWIYWNVRDRNYDSVPEPSAATDKSDTAYRCLSLERAQALEYFRAADVEIGGQARK